MKLERLYTRGQFDKILKERFLSTGVGMVNSVGRECFELELKFGELHEQPLAEEMFVNPLEKPNMEDYLLRSAYIDAVYCFEEAEKKVIFNNVTFQDRNMFEKDIFLDGLFVGVERKDKTFALGGKTIHDIAEITKGRITLKNVTI